MAMTRSAPIKVGLLSLFSVALLTFILFWLGGRGLGTGRVFEVQFTDVDGLREGAPVQLMGIRVGFVDAIRVALHKDRYAVNVRFSVNHPDATIPEGSRLSIEQSGIVGEKFIEITPPRPIQATLTTMPDAADWPQGPDARQIRLYRRRTQRRAGRNPP